MITRDIAQLYVVPALTHANRFHSCTVTGLTCYTDGATSAIGSSEFFPGYVIDRLGLPRAFRSFLVAPVLHGAFGSTGTGAGDILIGSLTVGVMHASASGGTYAAYSTGSWLVGQSLWKQTTSTSTGSLAFSSVQRDVGFTSEIGIGGLTSTTTSTAAGATINVGTSSTGLVYYAGPGPIFSTEGMKRFIKVVIRPQWETTGCGAPGFHLSAAGIFGEPDLAIPPLPAKRILVTSGCAT
jgi:hypothetical protein